MLSGRERRFGVTILQAGRVRGGGGGYRGKDFLSMAVNCSRGGSRI